MVIDEANLNKSILKLTIPAVGLITTLVNFVIALFVALSTGCTVIVARLMGEEDTQKAEKL